MIVTWCRFGDPLVLYIFRDVTLTQLVTAFLYEMGQLMRVEALDKVNQSSITFTACVRFLLFSLN